MYSSAYVWAKILRYLEERFDSLTVSTWLDDAEVVELNEEHLILYTPSDFRREIIRRRCTDFIQDALKEIFSSDAKLIVFGEDELTAYQAKGKQTTSMDFNPQFTFDNLLSVHPTVLRTAQRSLLPITPDRCTTLCLFTGRPVWVRHTFCTPLPTV